MVSKSFDQQDDERARLLEIIQGKPDLEIFVASLVNSPERVGTLLDIIRRDHGSVKFFCDNAIRTLSEAHPDLVYPWFEEIADLIHSPNHFIQWGSLRTIANLIGVDRGRQFLSIKDEYLDLIDDETMITAATVAGVAWNFVRTLPDLGPEITGRLLKVVDNTYLHKGEPSPECRDIMIGHVLDCFDQYFEISTRQHEILAFAQEQTKNKRKSTARKAGSSIKKYAKST